MPPDDLARPGASRAAGAPGTAGPAARLLAAFERIHRERMRGLGILNPRLAVAVVEGQHWQGCWLGVLITPWLMSLVALPQGQGAAQAGPGIAPGPEPEPSPPDLRWRPGAVFELALPAGTFALGVSAEPDLGPFATCSLFSPMGGFPDQETAAATARAVLDALFVPDSAGRPRPAPTPSRPPAGPGISRRALLRRGLGRD